MSQYKKLYKRMKTLNIILIVLVAVCLALIAFLLTRLPVERAQNSSPDQTSAPTVITTAPTVPSTTATEVPTEPQISEPQQEDPTMIWIDTPYIRLSYSAQWERYLQYEYTQRNGVYTSSFSCRIAGQLIRLFDIHFGTVNEGDFLGYILKDGQRIPVCITPYDYMPDDSWREEDTYVLYSMQEGINDVIQCVMAYESFSRGE